MFTIENLTINIYVDKEDFREAARIDTEFTEELKKAQDALVNPKKDYWEEEITKASMQEVVPEEPEFSVGVRVGMLGTDNEVPVGAVGTVTEMDGFGCLLVAWDGFTNGHNNDGTPAKGPFWWVTETQLEKLTLKEGALVVFTGRDPLEENTGYAGISLIGKIGELVEITEDDDYVVEFEGWTDGHDGDVGDNSSSRWYCTKGNLEVIG